MIYAELRRLKAEYRKAVLAAARLEAKRVHPRMWPTIERDLKFAKRDIARLEELIRKAAG